MKKLVARIILAIALALGPVAVLACGALTPAEQAHVAADGVKLSVCFATAHLCKLAAGDSSMAPCWAEFDACMVAHGYADASVATPKPKPKPLDPDAPADAGVGDS